MANPNLKIGMLFSTFRQFKDAVKNYSIRSRNQVIFGPNTKTKCKAKCKKGCEFFIWAYLKTDDKNTVQIKSAKFDHSCTKEHYNRHVNAKYIAMKYVERFRADPSWAIQCIIQTVKEDMAVDVSRLKAWRARNIALKFIDGDAKEQLGRLHDYKLELLRSNPGSTIVLHLEEQVFKGLYVYFGALKDGFKYCRPLISIDGCWLKGIYGGQLLTAVAVDANDCIYPVAWAVVQKENKDNWKWFLDLLAADLGLNNSHHWTFVSDRQKGLIRAIEEIFLNAEHRFCVRHVHNNLKKNFNTLGLKERFDLTGIPCCHAVCAIWYKHDNPENYLDDYYKVQNVTPSLSIQTEFDIPSHLVDLDDINLHWTSLSQTVAGTQRPHQNTRSINELLSDIPTQSSGVNEDSQPSKKNGKAKTVKNKGKTMKNKGNKPFLPPRSASLSTASKKASGSNSTLNESLGKGKDKVQATTKKAKRKENVETATSKKKKPWMPAGLGDNNKP
eukprot:XP_015581275.1 uncharacterized protein LOC107262099 [Ricinus communis]